MIAAYRKTTVTWVRAQGSDQWGTPLAAVDQDVQVQLLEGTKLVLNPEGEQVLSSAMLRVEDKPSHEDNFAWNGVSHIILRIDTKRIFSRISHYEVYVQ
jgi:hypothetical protein